MTLPRRASQLPVKYERSRETHRTGVTIFEVSDSGLYRVLATNCGEFDVQTLTLYGWIDLIRLGDADSVSTPVEAMQLWLDIQSPAAVVRHGEEIREIDQIAESTASTVLSEHGLQREPGESALSALGWAQGKGIDYEAAFRAFAKALIGELKVIDLLDAKIELLAEHKLEYPQNYAPEDIAAMQSEIARLRARRSQLTD